MSFAFYNGIRLQREPHDAPYLQKECTIPDHADLKQSIENIDALPAMLAIAKKMLALDLDTDTGETQLLKLIAKDPPISTRIIGLSNASLFGSPGIISSVYKLNPLLSV